MNPDHLTQERIRSANPGRNTAVYPGNGVPRRRPRRLWVLDLVGIFRVYLRHRLQRRSPRDRRVRERPHVLLFTYDLHNLGCQALAFSAIAYLKQHYPHKRIHVLVFRRERHVPYAFDVHSVQAEEKVRLLDRRNHDLKEILEQSCLAMDVSGLIFSHAMGWKLSLHFLLNLMLAREYGIPFVVYPQTLGPLNYPFLLRRPLHLLAAAYLPGAEKIFARERAGLAHLQHFGLDNLALSPDAVLASPAVSPGLIYTPGDLPEATLPPIDADTVAWVPNVRFNERIAPERMRAMNRCGIQALLDGGWRVVVLCHAASDIAAGRDAAGLFRGNGRVALLEEPPDSIHVVELLGRCRFVVSQRYHAVVHALKTHTPALALSWDDKYTELYARLGLEEFCLDIRAGFSLEELRAAVAAMSLQADDLRSRIAFALEGLSLRPVWDCLDQVLSDGEAGKISRPA
ncbi:MAG: polysaccharide pyruvyl transferase family protein [Candidatus Aminicenantes bacterium]|nr:polysaccharide pyruvyl transferase family protein [Candidatus Aminicenantes bacterium]